MNASSQCQTNPFIQKIPIPIYSYSFEQLFPTPSGSLSPFISHSIYFFVVLYQFRMQDKPVPKTKPVQRGKAQSFTHGKTNKCLIDPMTQSLEFSTLSHSNENSPLLPQTRRLNNDQLIDYIKDVLEQVYKQDPVKVRQRCLQFMRQHCLQLKGKIQERMSLMKYLEQSLKYRSFAEIQGEVLKEWRKNPFLFSLATVWGQCMLAHKFKNAEEMTGEYDRFRNFLANLTHFYFRGSLAVLGTKGVDTLSLFFEETSHAIIGGLKEWKDIHSVLMQMLKLKSMEINLEFDLHTLKVNPHFLRPTAVENQLPQTTALLGQLTQEYRIPQKISLLKKIRVTFLAQITQSSNRIASEQKLVKVSQFEKDDILDCMIYCIVRGQFRTIGCSLEALQLLVGRESGLLSKKGVDSYRADLQGAVEYLCNDHTLSLVKLPKHLMSTNLTQ